MNRNELSIGMKVGYPGKGRQLREATVLSLSEPWQDMARKDRWSKYQPVERQTGLRLRIEDEPEIAAYEVRGTEVVLTTARDLIPWKQAERRLEEQRRQQARRQRAREAQDALLDRLLRLLPAGNAGMVSVQYRQAWPESDALEATFPIAVLEDLLTRAERFDEAQYGPTTGEGK